MEPNFVLSQPTKTRAGYGAERPVGSNPDSRLAVPGYTDESWDVPSTPTSADFPFTSRIQKGGALLGDMRQLVCQWQTKGAEVAPHRFVRDVLPKATQARASDTYVRAFLPRMIEGSPKDAWKLCAVLEDCLPSMEVVVPFYYWITARAETILYRFASEELYSMARSGAVGVGTSDVTNWITKTCKQEGKVWSDIVIIKVARAMLAALRDFGVLSGASKKSIAASHLSLEAFALIAWCLRNQLEDNRDLKSHPDWRLFLVSPENVERLLLEAHQHGWLHYQVAGAVTRIEFHHNTFYEFVRAVVTR